ncbi:MAG TPA: ABC transporter substrate-binding protein [Terriglobales bacterium]|nr:ABC transporter substrate-binding protein [Terriglobales bacterium]
MKFICLLLAAALSLAAAPLRAATRPHYGGTLRMETRGAIASFGRSKVLDADDQALEDWVLSSVCDRLVIMADDGSVRPRLAISWRSDLDLRSWHFALRPNVMLQNGNPLSPAIIIASLAAANPTWHVRTEAGELLIQSDAPIPNLPAQLAEIRNSVCVSGDGGQWVGSGPFQIGEFQPGQRMELRAFDSWSGRPFLDRIRIEMGKSLAEQATDFQLGRAELIENSPTLAPPQRLSKISTSQPMELLAVVFAANTETAMRPRLRQAIALSLDRASIYSVLLRRQGEPSAALLPEWISGYAHLFSSAQDLARARQVRAQMGSVPTLTLGYDPGDTLAKSIAERVAVNAREVNVAIQPIPIANNPRAANPDARIVRVRIESPDPGAALASLASPLNASTLTSALSLNSADAIYRIENNALQDFLIIPIAHIPEAFMLGPMVHDWEIAPWGELNLGDLWMEPAP